MRIFMQIPTVIKITEKTKWKFITLVEYNDVCFTPDIWHIFPPHIKRTLRIFSSLNPPRKYSH